MENIYCDDKEKETEQPAHDPWIRKQSIVEQLTTE